jgi:hypothetical protein
MEHAIFKENSSGKRGILKKYVLIIAREFEHLTETLKEKV